MNPGVEAVLPLTAAQRGIYLETSAHAATYLGQFVVELCGSWSSALLAQAWLEVQEHHAGLRSHIGTYREAKVLVVRSRPPSQAGRFDLRSAERHLARAEAARICDDEARRGIDISRGPLARLTLIDVEADTTWLCLTHHHIGLDGVSIRTVLEDLATRCAAVPLKPTAALDELLRAWPEPGGATVQVRTGEPLSTFSIASSARSLVRRSCAAETSTLREASRRAGTSPATLVISAWMCALRTLRKTDLTVAPISVDRRPAEIPISTRTVGMLTDTVLTAERVPTTASPRVIAEQLAERLTPPVALPPLTSALEWARRDGAIGSPDSLLTIYTGDLLGMRPGGATWTLIRALEPTEFAVDATLELTDEQVRCELQLDTRRVDEQTANRLAENFVHFLENPSASVDDRPAASAALAHPSAKETMTPGLEAAVQDVVKRVVGFDPGIDTDLYTAGMGSLSLLALAVALRELGYPVGVGALLESGTIRRIARYLNQESPTPVALARTESQPSPLEAGYLRLSSDPTIGSAPMHEQSVLTFAKKLDAVRLAEALCSCLDSLPSLARLWDRLDSLTRPASITPRFELAQENPARSLESLLRGVLDADLADTFAPDGSGLLRLVQVPSDATTALVLSFHHAILDGWSFATFMRSLQQRYEAPGCAIDAEDADLYRRWALSSEHDSAGLEAHLHGLRASHDFSINFGERVSGQSFTQLSHMLVADRAKRGGASEISVLVGALALALRELLGWDEAHPIGLRATVRDGSLAAGERTVGQLTVDMPLRKHGDSLVDAATAVRETVLAVHRHGHLGQQVISHALAGDRATVVSLDTTLVLENYFARDELALRKFDRAAWSEVGSWRRDVSGTPRTITLVQRTRGWTVGVTSTIDRSPHELASAIVAHAASVLRDGAR